ncbi:MAG: RND transporter [Ruminococcus flavefaciens]|nr:RND transporter [Ruminococcus flavefaciens]MCM1231190.1 RND transporter [Ruminococcus flavefaciens]
MADIQKMIKDDKDNYIPNKKREVIKTVLIIFLAVLLVLTFFSNTIMNRSLAEISTERATSGKLTERLRGSGLVESNQSYGVTVDGNKVVDTVMVKTGKEVEKGDVLFTVGTGESEELTAAEDALSALELDYQKALLAPPADYTTENQAIKNAREDLATAIQKRDSAVANQGNVQTAKDNYNYNKSQLNYYTKLQTKLTAVISAIDMDEYMSAPAEYTSELINSRNIFENAKNDYNSAYSFYMALIGSDNGNNSDSQDNMQDDVIPQVTEPPVATVVSAEEIASAKADMEAKESEMNTAEENYNTLKYNLRNDYTNQLTDAENNIDWYTSLVEDYEANNMGDGMTIDQLNEDITAKQRTLEELITSLNKTMQDNDTQDKINTLDLEAKKKEIEKAKKQVDKLKKETETTEIKSEHSGVVSAVNIKAGDTTVPDMELVTIDIAEEGYTVKLTVEAVKTQKIKKGVEAEVVNNWSGDIQAVLTDIKNDTTAGSKNRVLVFSVTGDVDSGSYIDLSIPCGSGNYDAIVPKSAVYEDKDGSFVLTVTSKSSPLGNRYYAQKVPVEIQASDEVSSAVSGNIGNGDYVLTAASKPVSAGDQVRMKEK